MINGWKRKKESSGLVYKTLEHIINNAGLFFFVFVKRNEKQTFLSKLSLPAGRTLRCSDVRFSDLIRTRGRVKQKCQLTLRRSSLCCQVIVDSEISFE